MQPRYTLCSKRYALCSKHYGAGQQILFRKEWKKLTAPQRTALLSGASNTAVSPDGVQDQHRWHPRVRSPGHHKGFPGWYHVHGGQLLLARRRCLHLEHGRAQGRVQEVSSEECTKKCLSRPVWAIVCNALAGDTCNCWLDCSLGVDAQTCRGNAHWNIVTPRTVSLVPSEGPGCCINVDVAGCAFFRAVKCRPELWRQKDASNLAITLWYKPPLVSYNIF